MEFQKVIEKRRSVRSYDPDRAVSKETIKALVEAAQLAPSWKNSQTARYHCVLDPSVLDEFRANCLPEFNAKNAENAPALVVTTFVKDKSGFLKAGEPNNEFGNGWGAYDLGLSNENFVLKASELGLSTLIMGIRDEAKIRQLLKIDEEEIIVAVIALGYCDASPDMPKRKAADEILTFI